MTKLIYILATIGALLASFSYWVGLFERPDFVYREFLLDSEKELFALVASSTELPFYKHIPRIISGTKDAISALENSSRIFADGAAQYGSPEGAEKLGVGLYFDDPAETSTPRWANGWLVGVEDFEEAQALASEANKASELKEMIVAVRIGPGPCLVGRLPWRSMLTPMFAPAIQWTRAFQEYDKGGYKAEGRNDKEGPIACEFYITGPNDSSEHIDYTVLMGDVSNTWADVFPEETE